MKAHTAAPNQADVGGSGPFFTYSLNAGRDDTMPKSRRISATRIAQLPLLSFMPDSPNYSSTENVQQMPEHIAHYRIVQRLGKGGMGEVFLGEDTKQHSGKVALKVLLPELTQDESRLRRFKQEARAVLTLNHPNILTIFEIGQTDSTYYIATEFIEGDTLRQYLWQNQIKIDEAIGIAIQVAMALEAAHAAGIVHRDIKPENIMLRNDRFVRDRLVKVLDFGLAKLVERDGPAADPDAKTMTVSNTNPGVILGTTGYMSPEQAQGETVDTRTDIFSLGVVLYEMVAGRAPFTGATDSHVRVSLIDHDPPPLSQYLPDVPRQLERIASKALAKDRGKRYQTITDLKIDLEQLREELIVSGANSRDDTESARGPRLAHLTGDTPVTTVLRSSVKETQIDSAPVVLPIERPGTTSRYRSPALILLAGVVLLAAAGVYFRYSRHPINSVAILPFVNDSNEPNAEYLSDGITESIINSLSQLPNLKVMSRNAVFRFKGRNMDPMEVGHSLQVGAVLMGRLEKRDDRLVIKTELIDVSDGSQLWGAVYNNSLADILSVQDEIARTISEKLRFRLTGQDEEKISKRYTKDAEAYELYLKGRYFWNKRGEAGLRNGIKHFKAAQERDPAYALAYSGLADSYALLCDIGVVAPVNEMPLAKAAAQKSVDIDPLLAEGYTSRAFVKLAYDWDWQGAETDFKKALDLNPQYPTAHQWYASYLVQMGKFDRARQEIEQAQQLDPLSPIISSNAGLYSYFEHRYDDAITQYKRTLEIDPGFWVAHHYMGLAYAKKGAHEAAIGQLRGLLESPGEGPLKEGAVEKDPEVAASLGFIYATAGKRSDAEAILERLKALSERRYVSGLYLAIVYAGLKDQEHALEYLNKAYESRHPGLVLIRVDPIFDDLRSDERFKQLVKRFEPMP
jgi:serine/threonine protein kinase/tetratricopeptide (TPR) repeat protein